MKNKKKTSKFKSKKVEHEFTGKSLTLYSGLSPYIKYINRIKLGKALNALFPTIIHNASKFSNVQILISVILASLSGVNRLKRIAHFTNDSLVSALLGLPKGLNKDVIGVRLKSLGIQGVHKLQEFIFGWQKEQWLEKYAPESITLDGDSTVITVYGNQEGAAKGYNPHKRGAKSYHPIILFLSDLRMVVNSWFRIGSAYTSNGICDIIKQTKTILPSKIKSIFFRGDSGFFNGALFDLLEEYGWSYLVKVKLKNLKELLERQQWQQVPGKKNIWICEFNYKGKGWKKSRTIKAIRTVKRYVKIDFFGEELLSAEYEYVAYCSNLDLGALELDEKYRERATSENWIEEVKNQLMAGKNITNDFWANDILWQLQILAYNISVMMRYKSRRFWKKEHKTIRDFIINVPGLLVKGGRSIKLKIYENYYYKHWWLEFEQL
jgi:hypothetical protein